MKNEYAENLGIKGIGRIILGVRDLDRSREFYEGLLSTDRPTRTDVIRERRGLCSIEDCRSTFGLRLREGLAIASRPSIEHFCFRTDSKLALRALHGRAINLGAAVTSPQGVDGEWQFFMYDPDGHKIGVYTPGKG